MLNLFWHESYGPFHFSSLSLDSEICKVELKSDFEGFFGALVLKNPIVAKTVVEDCEETVVGSSSSILKLINLG